MVMFFIENWVSRPRCHRRNPCVPGRSGSCRCTGPWWWDVSAVKFRNRTHHAVFQKCECFNYKCLNVRSGKWIGHTCLHQKWWLRRVQQPATRHPSPKLDETQLIATHHHRLGRKLWSHRSSWNPGNRYGIGMLMYVFTIGIYWTLKVSADFPKPRISDWNDNWLQPLGSIGV